MKKLGLGCGGLLLLLIGCSVIRAMLGIREMRQTAHTMFRQFAVGAPIVPFSLTPGGSFIIISFGRPQHRCLDAIAKKNEVTLSYEGRNDSIPVDSFSQKLASLRDVVVRCDELSVYISHAAAPPMRAAFHVRYDHTGIVSELIAPRVGD